MADLMPTMLDLLGSPIPRGLDGVPLDQRREPILLEAQSPHSIWPSDTPNVFGAIDGQNLWKVMVTPDGVLCFDLEADPQEKQNRPELLTTRAVQTMLEMMNGYGVLDS